MVHEDVQVTEQELIQFCRSQIASSKCPIAIGFTNLPKTSTDKVQKYLLRNQEWAGHERKISGA